MNLFKKFSSIAMVGVLTTSAFLFPVGDNNVSANSEGKNEKAELKFELSPEGRYDITFKDKSNGEATMSAMSKSRTSGADISVVGEYKYSPNTVTVEMNDKAVKALAKNPNVLKIEPDLILEPQSYYSEPFHEYASWSIKATNSDVAYSQGFSGQGVDVAVIDTGIDTDSPMLTHAIKGGVSVVDSTNSYEDDNGHGTAVAGTIAGKYQGQPYGIAPDVNIYAVKATSSATSGGRTSDIVRGIEWAIDNGMDAVNVSFAPAGDNVEAFVNVSQRAYDLGIPLFNPAGNAGDNKDLRAGRCHLVGTYCVSALLETNELADFSAYGRDYIAFSSYGGGVQVVDNGTGRPVVSSGTSFSSPMALGTFALYKSKYPTMNGNQIIQLMKDDSINVSQFNPNKAVANLAVFEDGDGSGGGNNPEPIKPITPVAPANPNISLVSVNGKEVKVRVTVPNDSATFNRLQFDFYWTSSLSDYVATMGDTRTYDLTFTAPSFNTTYQIDVMAFNGDKQSNWSNVLAFTTGGDGSGGGNNNTIIEDFSDNTFNFNFSGNWYRDTAKNAFRSSVIPHNGSSTSTFTVDAGANGATLSIDYRTSSENYADTLEILVNGTRHVATSGILDNFSTTNINLPSGTHTIKFNYFKDASVAKGEDAGFVDNIKLVKK